MIKQKDMKKSKHSRSIRQGMRGQTPIATSSGTSQNLINGPDSLAQAISGARKESGIKSQVRGSMNGVGSLAAKQSKHDNFLRHVVMPPNNNQGGGNKITDKLDADLKLQSNLRAINNFMSTEPIKPSLQNHHQSSYQAHQTNQNILGNNNSNNQSSEQQQSAVDLKNYEDRKKAVAAIYLNQMSNKMQANNTSSNSHLLHYHTNDSQQQHNNQQRKVRRGSDTGLTGMGLGSKHHASSVTQQIDMGSLVGHRVGGANNSNARDSSLGGNNNQRAASLNRSGYLYGQIENSNSHARQRSVTNNSFQGTGNNNSGSHFKMRADYSAKRNSRGSSNHHTASHIPNASSHNTYLKIGGVNSQQLQQASNQQNQEERDPYQQVNQNSLVHERVKKQLSKFKTGSSSETHLRQASDGQIHQRAPRRDLSNNQGGSHYHHHSVGNQNSFVENPRLVRNLIHQQSHGILQNGGAAQGTGSSSVNQKSPLINSRKVFDPVTYANQAQSLSVGQGKNQSGLSMNQNSKREKSYSNSQIASNLYGVPSTLASSKGNLSSNQRHQKNLSAINLPSSNIQSQGGNHLNNSGNVSYTSNQPQKLDQSDLLFQPSSQGYPTHHVHSQSLANAAAKSSSTSQHKHAKLSTKLFKSLHQHHHSSSHQGQNILSQTQQNPGNLTHSYQTASVSSLQNPPTKDHTLNNSQNVQGRSKRHAYLEVKDQYQNQPKLQGRGTGDAAHSMSKGRLIGDESNNSKQGMKSASIIGQSASSGQILNQQSGQQLFQQSQLRPNFSDETDQQKQGIKGGPGGNNHSKNIQIIKKPAQRLHKPSLSNLGRDLTSNSNKEQAKNEESHQQQMQYHTHNDQSSTQHQQQSLSSNQQVTNNDHQHSYLNPQTENRLFNTKMGQDSNARNGPHMQTVPQDSTNHLNSKLKTDSQFAIQQQQQSDNSILQGQSGVRSSRQANSAIPQRPPSNITKQQSKGNESFQALNLPKKGSFQDMQFQTHDNQHSQSQQAYELKQQNTPGQNNSSSVQKKKNQQRSHSQSELKGAVGGQQQSAQGQQFSMKQRSVDSKNFYQTGNVDQKGEGVQGSKNGLGQQSSQQPYINLENNTNRSSKFSRHSRQRTSQQPSVGTSSKVRANQATSNSYNNNNPNNPNQQQTGNHDFENFTPTQAPPTKGPIEGFLVVKQFGQASMAGNVGRTASAKTNQDSLFITKIGFDNQQSKGGKNAPKQTTSDVDWFVAVADGHGANGHFVSQYIAQHLPKQYETDKRKLDKQTKNSKGGDLSPAQKILDLDDHEGLSEAEKNERRIKRALVSSYLNTQQKLEKQSHFDVQLSGSTVVGCYCHQNTLIFANAGDSRAIFIGQQVNVQNTPEYTNERGGSQFDNSLVILAQTRDHKPDLPDEADRILNHYDGQINNTHAQTLVIQAIQGVNSVAPPKPSQKFGPPRVWVHNQTYPGLAMSRSLGDALAKKAGVVAEPEISHYKYDPELVREIAPRFIVLASDGVWDVMSNEQVATMVCDPRNANKSAQKLAEMLLKTSRQRWLIAPANQGVQSEQYADIDDISVVVLKMDFQITSQ